MILEHVADIQADIARFPINGITVPAGPVVQPGNAAIQVPIFAEHIVCTEFKGNSIPAFCSFVIIKIRKTGI